jgi:spermidine synthase
MLGLVVGSLSMRRRLKARRGLGVGTLAAFDAGLAIFAVLVPAAVLLLSAVGSHGEFAWAVEWGVMLLVLTSGLLGGSVFPLSAEIVLREVKETGRTAGSVVCADQVGACVGALVTGVVLIPAVGMFQTCLVIGLLKLLSCLFLVAARRGRKSAATPTLPYA